VAVPDPPRRNEPGTDRAGTDRPGPDRAGAGPALAAWTPTRAFGRAVMFIGILLLTGLFTRRPDLVVIAAPFAVGAAAGLWHRPRTIPRVRLSAGDAASLEGAEITSAIDVDNADPVRYDLVVARLEAHWSLRLRHGERPYATAVEPGASAGIDLVGRSVRWGRYPLGPVVAHAVAADGLLVSPPGFAPALAVRVYPQVENFRADEAMPRAAGMIGFHRSRRPGEGGELAGVRVFSPGDRLRRVDWRVSLRTRQLHVAATLSERDAEVVVLLDLLYEAGVSTGIFGDRSVLDVTVRAAAGIGDHYLHHGDRVSFVEYGWQGRRLRASSGHRHYLTLMEWLLDVRAAEDGREPPGTAFGAHLGSADALTIVLTPLISTKSAAMLARLARGGRFVVAVDTMPPDLIASLSGPRRGEQPTAIQNWTRSGEFTSSAARLWRLERENHIDALREHGVPVVAWAGAGSLDEVLRQVTRVSSGPRGVPR